MWVRSLPSPPRLLGAAQQQHHHHQQVLRDGSEDEAPYEEAAGSLLASLPTVQPPHNVLASSCSHSWKSLGSRGRCRRLVRGEMLAGQMMGLVSEGLAALYTPENKNWEWTVLCVLKIPFVSPFTVYSSPPWQSNKPESAWLKSETNIFLLKNFQLLSRSFHLRDSKCYDNETLSRY